MRGVYKVPGGKLVALDLAVAEGKLAQVRLSGDFFLEPADAAGRIERALEGAPSCANAAELSARIVAGLEAGDALIGFDARAVAIAARRALGLSTSWGDHAVELIVDGPRAPAMHMALDQVYAEATSRGDRGPTLRFWEWGSPAIVLGSFQSLRNEVDDDAARRHGIAVVRRISGGGAMFVEPGNTITYSLVVPGSLVDSMSFEESYAFLDAWVIRALGELGIQAAHVPLNDIASPGGKIAGAAQRRLNDGTVLHHVTMAYDIDATKTGEVLRIGREKLSDKGVTSAAKRIDPLRSQTGMTRGEVVAALIASFERQYGLVRSAPRDSEISAAKHLETTKFTTQTWLSRVP